MYKSTRDDFSIDGQTRSMEMSTRHCEFWTLAEKYRYKGNTTNRQTCSDSNRQEDKLPGCQTGRNNDRQIERQTHKQWDKESDIQTGKHTGMQSDRFTNRKKQIGMQRDIHTGRGTNRHTGRETGKHAFQCTISVQSSVHY